MAAPLNNKNGVRGKRVRDGFHYALAKLGQDIPGDDPAYQKGINALCLVQVKLALAGDRQAFHEIADRIDGKAVQGVEITGNDGEEMDTKWTLEFVVPDLLIENQ